MLDLREIKKMTEVKPPSLETEVNNEDENTPQINRQCGECTMCCQGWLTGEAYGRPFFPGMPCHYVGCNGCSIYEQRPEEPCKTYRCVWLNDGDLLPEWFRPDKSKIICTWRQWKEDEYYLDVTECGEKMQALHLHWLMDLQYNQGINLSYSLVGSRYCYGSDEFIKWTNETFQ